MFCYQNEKQRGAAHINAKLIDRSIKALRIEYNLWQMNALSSDDHRLKRWPFGALDLLETVLFYFWKDHKYFKIDGNGFNKWPRKLFSIHLEFQLTTMKYGWICLWWSRVK